MQVMEVTRKRSFEGAGKPETIMAALRRRRRALETLCATSADSLELRVELARVYAEISRISWDLAAEAAREMRGRSV